MRTIGLIEKESKDSKKKTKEEVSKDAEVQE